MNIKFIGTGSMISSDNQACYLINNSIMIDVPNGSVKNIKKLDSEGSVKSVNNLFITHIHGDHYFDLPFLLLAKYKDGEELNVYVSRWCLPKIYKLVKLAFPREYFPIRFAKNIHFITNSHEVEIDGMKFNRFKVKHGKMKPAFGYTISYKDKIVTFTGDAMLDDAIKEKASISDYLICDCTLVNGTEKHMGADNIKVLLTNKNLTIIPSHMSPKAKMALKEMKESNLLIKEDLEELDI